VAELQSMSLCRFVFGGQNVMWIELLVSLFRKENVLYDPTDFFKNK
jgi:hypothetical protein